MNFCSDTHTVLVMGIVLPDATTHFRKVYLRDSESAHIFFTHFFWEILFPRCCVMPFHNESLVIIKDHRMSTRIRNRPSKD